MTPFKHNLIKKLSGLYKYNFTTGCVEYTGSLNRAGYGVITLYGFNNKKSYLVHRLVAYLAGTLNDLNDPTEFACHSCDNRKCIDIRHLYSGDNFTNQQDTVDRKRHVNSKKEECKYGHPLSSGNLYVYFYNGKYKRACKTCKRNRKLGIKMV